MELKIDNLVLLAGGLATRLKPVSENIPKSMIEFSGRPFIFYQLKLIKKAGVKRVIVCTGYLGEQIAEYIKNGNYSGLNVEFVVDGDKPLGTGGAIKNALPLLSDNFFVMYGDSYLNTDFNIINEYFLQKKKQGLMTVYKNEGKWDKSNIEFENGEIIKYDKKLSNEKMKYIDYGLGILNKEAFSNFQSKEVFDLEEIYKNLLQKNELAGFEVKERFYEIGSFEGLEETRKHLEMNNG